ncbi:MAG: hypothetical protein JNK10_06100 [Cyclobacteriaceae bacterium]|nr:hypothetical protein [Cyclobacteriaceae bacterium]
MKRLEDIPKKTIYEVPDGYFDRLPGAIQARVAQQPKTSAWVSGRYAIKYALPLLALVVVAVVFISGPSNQSAEEILAGIDSEQLVAYLEETDINADDLMTELDLDPEEIIAIEEGAFDEINLDDSDMESLTDEFETIQQ